MIFVRFYSSEDRTTEQTFVVERNAKMESPDAMFLHREPLSSNTFNLGRMGFYPGFKNGSLYMWGSDGSGLFNPRVFNEHDRTRRVAVNDVMQFPTPTDFTFAEGIYPKFNGGDYVRESHAINPLSMDEMGAGFMWSATVFKHRSIDRSVGSGRVLVVHNAQGGIKSASDPFGEKVVRVGEPAIAPGGACLIAIPYEVEGGPYRSKFKLLLLSNSISNSNLGRIYWELEGNGLPSKMTFSPDSKSVILAFDNRVVQIKIPPSLW